MAHQPRSTAPVRLHAEQAPTPRRRSRGMLTSAGMRVVMRVSQRVALGLGLGLALSGTAQAQQGPLARGDLAIAGVSIEINKLERVPNQKVVEMRFTLVNGSAQSVSLAALGLERQYITNRGTVGSVDGIKLLDLANGLSYAPGIDGGYSVSSRWPSPESSGIAANTRRSFWVWFGAPAAGVTKVSIYPPGAAPLLDLPLGGK